MSKPIADPQGTPAPETKPEPTPKPEPAAEKPKTSTDDLPPEALTARLKREHEAGLKEALRELGVENIKDAKVALDAYKKLQHESMTEAERIRTERDEYKSKAEKADEYAKVVSEQATAALSSLTEAQTETVTKLAGDDPVRQLQVVTQLRASGMLGSPPPEPKKMAAPASTAPPQSAPAPTATTEQQQALSTYESLKARNPVEAARYHQRHYAAISAARSRS